MKVTEVVKKYSDGRMDVITKGKNIFKLNAPLYQVRYIELPYEP